MQTVRDTHDTLASQGACRSDQLKPSQRSTTGTMQQELPDRGGGGPGTNAVPRAVHAVGDEHDTAVRPPLDAPRGLGVGWIDHRLPFQRSARASPELPTASQAAGDAHDTAARSLFDVDEGFVGFGVRWIDQPDASAPDASASDKAAAATTAITRT
jgi:hypothetical protein